MCGIAACYNKDLETTVRYLRSSFERLEYRGYDACGYCILSQDKEGNICPHILKFVNEKPRFDYPIYGDKILGGLIHTRWASVGKNSKENTHPFQKWDVVLAHNGNFNVDKYKFVKTVGETDSEILASLMSSSFLISQSDDLEKNVFDNFKPDDHVSTVFFHKDKLFAMNFNGLLYYTLDGYIASDPICFKDYNPKYFILGDKEYIKLGPNQTMAGNKLIEPKHVYTVSEKDDLSSNMFLEIKRQVKYTKTFDPQIKIKHKDIPQIVILACGSSYYAGQLGKKYIEEKCNIPVDVEYASEFLNQPDKYRANTIFLALSQSGETKDVLDAIAYVKSLNRDYPTLAICNRENSALTRLVDQTIYTNCGPENAVAATISFTGQVLTLLSLAKFLRGDLWDRKHLEELSEAIKKVMTEGKDVLLLGSKSEWFYFFDGHKNIVILGTEYMWPIAQEAALKIKEVTYTHCEAIPAGEMKHGPLALIDDQMCTFLLLTNYKKLDKVFFNAREILARHGKLIIISDDSVNIPDDISKQSLVIILPQVIKRAQPIVHLVFMQMFAAQYGVNLGININRPRSLAKSITV